MSEKICVSCGKCDQPPWDTCGICGKLNGEKCNRCWKHEEGEIYGRWETCTVLDPYLRCPRCKEKNLCEPTGWEEEECEHAMKMSARN